MPFAFVLDMILKREGKADGGFMIVRVIQLYCYLTVLRLPHYYARDLTVGHPHSDARDLTVSGPLVQLSSKRKFAYEDNFF